ncbi:MAG: MATE family efflux transporter [Prevotellaceae bacterium]|jgi:putative MATE family efflux protein|nr:MATE family efflux transporter [Prevotellaceae bacterium]
MTSNSTTQELGTGKIPKLLKRYAIPSIIAMTAATLYNLMDSVFIGHGVGALALSGLTLSMPLMNLAAAFGAMVGIGASSLMSIKLGQNDKSSAKSILGNALLLNLIIGFLFGAGCLIFLDKILYFFGASDDTIGYARDYMRILLYGNIFTHVYLGLNNILRTTGYPQKSMRIMLTAVISNGILNAIFIFGFGWGIVGAAWATVIAQFIAMILEMIHFLNKNHEIYFTREIFRLRNKIIKGILAIGMSPFLMNVTASLVVIVINNALKGTGGDLYIGAYGNVNRVALIFVMVVFGINQGMQPIVGYNFGAQKYDRVNAVLKLGIIAATCVTCFGFILGMFFPRLVAMAFTTDPTLLSVTEEGLRIVLLAFPIVGFQVVTSNFFQSIGMAYKAIFLSLTRQLIFLLPLLLILTPVWGSKGVWWSMPISDTIATILAAVLLINQYKKFQQKEQSKQLP